MNLMNFEGTNDYYDFANIQSLRIEGYKLKSDDEADENYIERVRFKVVMASKNGGYSYFNDLPSVTAAENLRDKILEHVQRAHEQVRREDDYIEMLEKRLLSLAAGIHNTETSLDELKSRFGLS